VKYTLAAYFAASLGENLLNDGGTHFSRDQRGGGANLVAQAFGRTSQASVPDRKMEINIDII
jgi:hypothetical protein